MEFKQLKAHIKQGKLLPCYHISGDDPYLVWYSVTLFKKQIPLPEFNVCVFEDEVETNQIINALSTLPLMADYKLITLNLPCVKDISKCKDYLSSSAVLLLLNGTMPTNFPLEPVNCNRLDQITISNYIKTQTKSQDCSITPDAISLLTQYCGFYMGQISTNLQKLMSYDKNITVQNVKELVTPMLEYRVFELTDAIIKQQPLKAKQILDDMLSQSSGSQKAFGIIYSHFRRLMFASLSQNKQELALNLNIKDYVAKLSIEQANQFTKARLKQFLDMLSTIDYQTKNISNDNSLLECFVYQASIRE